MNKRNTGGARFSGGPRDIKYFRRPLSSRRPLRRAARPEGTKRKFYNPNISPGRERAAEQKRGGKETRTGLKVRWKEAGKHFTQPVEGATVRETRERNLSRFLRRGKILSAKTTPEETRTPGTRKQKSPPRTRPGRDRNPKLCRGQRRDDYARGRRETRAEARERGTRSPGESDSTLVISVSRAKWRRYINRAERIGC